MYCMVIQVCVKRIFQLLIEKPQPLQENHLSIITMPLKCNRQVIIGILYFKEKEKKR